MTKTPPKLTQVQEKALDFIQSAFEREGTAPTLRELSSHMGYSAIGSAQDLVSTLRRKGFLSTPSKQTARSLILTPLALAQREPYHKDSRTSYLIYGFATPPIPGERGEKLAKENAMPIITLRLSAELFPRPYPDPLKLYAISAPQQYMETFAILKGDWLIIEQRTPGEDDWQLGDLLLAAHKKSFTLGQLAQAEPKHPDPLGAAQDPEWILRLDKRSGMIRPHNSPSHLKVVENFTLQEDQCCILGKIIAVQRCLS